MRFTLFSAVTLRHLLHAHASTASVHMDTRDKVCGHQKLDQLCRHLIIQHDPDKPEEYAHAYRITVLRVITAILGLCLVRQALIGLDWP